VIPNETEINSVEINGLITNAVVLPTIDAVDFEFFIPLVTIDAVDFEFKIALLDHHIDKADFEFVIRLISPLDSVVVDIHKPETPKFGTY